MIKIFGCFRKRDFLKFLESMQNFTTESLSYNLCATKIICDKNHQITAMVLKKNQYFTTAKELDNDKVNVRNETEEERQIGLRRKNIKVRVKEKEN